MSRQRIRRVVQADETGCGIACISMVSRRPYNYVARVLRERVLKKPNGVVYTRHRELQKVLRLLGLRGVKGRFHRWREIETPAIVPVGRTGSGRRWHWVVLREERAGRSVLDPAPGSNRFIRDFRGHRVRGYYITVRRPRLTS